MVMKKFLKILGIFFLALLLFGVAILVHAGLFESIVTTEQETGPYTLVYQDHLGSYSKVKPAMDEVYDGLLGMGIETTRGAGIYYDNPQQVAADKLRSQVGSLLEDQDLAKVSQIKQTFKIKEIPQQQAIVVEFPIKNMLSYIIGPAKVYGEANALWQQQGYPQYEYAVEIYDIPNKTITYIMPIREMVIDKIIMDEPIVVSSTKSATATEAAAKQATAEPELILE